MKHGRSFAELALAVTAVLLVAACGGGPGEAPDPKPVWSPPDWMHGSWSGTATGADGTAITGTVEVTAYNLVVAIETGSGTEGFDLAQLADQDVATILHVAGTSDTGTRQFAFMIKPNAGGTVNEFVCSEVDSTTMGCLWTQTTPPATEAQPVALIRLTKQPG